MKLYSFRRSMIITATLFLLLALSPMQAELAQRITWADLPAHLQQRDIPVEEAPVGDCPRDIEQQQPDRVVAQWIENTFYLWQEYDITNKGEAQQCIVMLKPEAKALTATEARTLLTGSSLWRKLAPTPRAKEETLDPTDPLLKAIAKPLVMVTEEDLRKPDRAAGISERGVAQAAKPMSPGKALSNVRPTRSEETRGVIGSDERVRVTNTDSFPWYLQCYLQQKYGSSYYRGSGCAVTPYMILTCGHNVYDQDSNSWADSITIVPGQKQYGTGETVYRPWGTRDAAWFRCNAPYTSGGNWAYDYAAVHFEYPFWSIATYLPVEFDTQLSQGDILNMSGYPSVAQDASTYGQWYCYGEVLEAADRIIRGNFDATGGNSGSALYYYVPSLSARRISGILAFGAPTYNGGPQLVEQNRDMIIGWMQWTPDREHRGDIPAAELIAMGTPFSVITQAGKEVELMVAAVPASDEPLLHLRYSPPRFMVEFEGTWMPVGLPNAMAQAYGKGFKLKEAHVQDGQTIWTLQHSLREGEFGVYRKQGNDWYELKRIQCQTP